ncbi:hypothetical protein F4810DRAFT_720386 [Camillea tinctor]|nr:hypothetical protein F4810DRAFT_720386 [Camillea tinctor]
MEFHQQANELDESLRVANSPVIWRIGYTHELIRERAGIKSDASSSKKQVDSHTSDKEKPRVTRANEGKGVKDAIDNDEIVKDPTYEPGDGEELNPAGVVNAEDDADAADDAGDEAVGDTNHKANSKPAKRTAKPRVQPRHHTRWVAVIKHGFITPDKVLAARRLLGKGDLKHLAKEDGDDHYGPARIGDHFDPIFEVDHFIVDRFMLGQLATPYGRDLFRARPNDVRPGARDATPVWFARLQNVIFLCSDTGSAFKYASSIINVLYPPDCNISKKEAFDPYRNLTRKVAFLSGPPECNHDDCRVLRLDLTQNMRVIGTKKLEGCPWWAFADFCFRDESICIRDFPHPQDILFGKGIPLATAESVALWTVSIFNHVGHLPDLRQDDEPKPERWGKRDTPAATDQRRYLDIIDADHPTKLAKLILRSGCNTAANYQQEALRVGITQSIANGQPCPSCLGNFFGSDDVCLFRLADDSALPYAPGSKISFLHYGCEHDHNQACNSHEGCTSSQATALREIHEGTLKGGVKPQKNQRKRKTATSDAHTTGGEDEPGRDTHPQSSQKRAKRNRNEQAAEVPAPQPLVPRNQEAFASHFHAYGQNGINELISYGQSPGPSALNTGHFDMTGNFNRHFMNPFDNSPPNPIPNHPQLPVDPQLEAFRFDQYPPIPPDPTIPQAGPTMGDVNDNHNITGPRGNGQETSRGQGRLPGPGSGQGPPYGNGTYRSSLLNNPGGGYPPEIPTHPPRSNLSDFSSAAHHSMSIEDPQFSVPGHANSIRQFQPAGPEGLRVAGNNRHIEDGTHIVSLESFPNTPDPVTNTDMPQAGITSNDELQISNASELMDVIESTLREFQNTDSNDSGQEETPYPHFFLDELIDEHEMAFGPHDPNTDYEDNPDEDIYN